MQKTNIKYATNNCSPPNGCNSSAWLGVSTGFLRKTEPLIFQQGLFMTT